MRGFALRDGRGGRAYKWRFHPRIDQFTSATESCLRAGT